MQEVEAVPVEELLLSEIYKEVCLNNELILVIEAVDEQRLRRALSVQKSKDNAKLKDAGLPPDDAKFEFIRIEDPELDKDKVKLQIVLKGPDRIKIFKKTIPSGELE